MRSAIALIVGVAAGVVVLSGSPASASPAGLQLVTATSAVNSTDFKSASATCPAGKKVIGGGAQANGLTSAELLVTQAYPDGTNNRFVAGVWEDEGRTADTWSVTAFAICANPLAGLEYVQTPLYTNIHGTWATCPAGKKLVGMGGYISNSDGQVALTGIFPASGSAPTRTETWVSEDDNGYSADYSIRSHSVCANPVTGLEWVVRTLSNTAGVGMAVDCPAGKKVLSSGMRLGAGAATAWQGEAKVSLMAPNSALTKSYISADQFAAAGDVFTAQVIAICA
jgi:hypothetical protein